MKNKFILSAIILLPMLAEASEASLTSGIATEDGTYIVLSDGSMRVRKGLESVLLNPSQPNRAGISTTQFDTFNVGTKGLKIDNSSKANVILAEVGHGKSPSKLRGNIDILENPAHFVLANPNGIECDRCSFSNINGTPFLAAAEVRRIYPLKSSNKYYITFKRDRESLSDVTVKSRITNLQTYFEKSGHNVYTSHAIYTQKANPALNVITKPFIVNEKMLNAIDYPYTKQNRLAKNSEEWLKRKDYDINDYLPLTYFLLMNIIFKYP